MGRRGDKVKNLLTDEQNKEFDAAMAYWQKALNLSDWRVERAPGVAKGAMAQVTTTYSARLASYKTGDFGGVAPTSETIKATALHEMAHVLLAELIYLVQLPNADDNMLESAEHRVVNTLEKLLQKVAP